MNTFYIAIRPLVVTPNVLTLPESMKATMQTPKHMVNIMMTEITWKLWKKEGTRYIIDSSFSAITGDRVAVMLNRNASNLVMGRYRGEGRYIIHHSVSVHSGLVSCIYRILCIYTHIYDDRKKNNSKNKKYNSFNNTKLLDFLK